MKPSCPSCGAEIPLDDVNVSKDTALCRACGTMHSFGALVHVEATEAPDGGINEPPPGASLQDLGNRYVLTATARNMALAGFMVFFTAFWNSITWIFVGMGVTGLLRASGVTLPGWWPAPAVSGGGGMGLGMAIFMLLFMVPFVCIGVFTLALAVMSMVGSCRVTIAGADGTVSTGVGVLRWTRRFDASRVTRVGIENANSSTNGKPDRQIILDGDATITFGTMLTQARRRWMAAALRELLVPRR